MGLARYVTEGTAEQVSYPPHLRLLNKRLVDLARGRGGRLLVTLPPRHGKSTATSRFFTAWFLLRWPHRRVLLASYEADFAARWGRLARDIIEEHGRTLAGVTVRPDSSAANRWDVVQLTPDGAWRRTGGSMNTAGVRGGLTGLGGDVVIVDDPVKDAEQAHSRLYRDRAWEWWQSVAGSRLEPGGRAVIIQTRWNEDDLTGRILARARQPGGEQWDHIDLPAVAEPDRVDQLGRAPGEPLWPQRYDAAALERARRQAGPYWWAALYQGRPAPAGGTVFGRSLLRYWRQHGTRAVYADPETGRQQSAELSMLPRRCYVDLALGERETSDYTVVLTAAIAPGGDLLVTDRVRERVGPLDLKPLLRSVFTRVAPHRIGVEATAFQAAVVADLQAEGWPVYPIPTKGSKHDRAITAATRMGWGRFWLPADAVWLDEYTDELLTFPNATHDDQVDVTGFMLADTLGRGTATPQIGSSDGAPVGSATPVEEWA